MEFQYPCTAEGVEFYTLGHFGQFWRERLRGRILHLSPPGVTYPPPPQAPPRRLPGLFKRVCALIWVQTSLGLHGHAGNKPLAKLV